MNILMQNRSKDAWIGGDYIQMEATAKALRAKGHHVCISDLDIYMPVGAYQAFDVVHLWNFSMSWTKPQMGLAILHSKPVVCSMIYHKTDKFVTYPEQRFMAERLNRAIFLNEGELKRFRQKVKIDDSKVEIIGNGIDDFWFERPSKGSYILVVGRVSSFKGQLDVAKACKQLKIPLHLVGEVHDDKYLDDCVKYGAIYKGIMNRDEMKEEYKGASVVVIASKNELMSLTAMEAIAMGKNIVLTTGSEWKPVVDYCKYGNISSIKKAISSALKKPYPKELRAELKELKWDKVAERLIKIYEQSISERLASKQKQKELSTRVLE